MTLIMNLLPGGVFAVSIFMKRQVQICCQFSLFMLYFCHFFFALNNQAAGLQANSAAHNRTADILFWRLINELQVQKEAPKACPHIAPDQKSCLMTAQLLMFHLMTFCLRPLRVICCSWVLISVKCNIKYKYCTSLLRKHHFLWAVDFCCCIIHRSEQKKTCQLKYEQSQEMCLHHVCLDYSEVWCPHSC